MNNNKSSLIIVNILICALMLLIAWSIIDKVTYMSGFAGLWLLGATISRRVLEIEVKKEEIENAKQTR
jgi:hypothetical protein